MEGWQKQQHERRILHFTLGRSGSAFISQILFAIFGPQNVWAGHEPVSFTVNPPQRLIITVRDFRDMAVSHWRVNSHGRDGVPLEQLDKGLRIPDSQVRSLMKHTAGSIGTLNAVRAKNPKALIMRYEEFFPDKFDFIFGKIEEHCGVVIPRDKKVEIRQNYTFEKNRERANKVGSFRQVGEEWMHGKHVYKGKIGGWKDMISPGLYQHVNAVLGPLLKQWDYEI